MSVARPILFSAPMIRALLDDRKTQTRRIAKVNDADCRPGFITPNAGFAPRKIADHLQFCPYGVPGDLLWVRESWCYVGPGSGSDLPEYVEERALKFNHKPENCWYRADGERGIVWTPSIHMFRWASRLTLRITDVRVERLRDISNDDAKAEGFSYLSKDIGHSYKYGIPDRDGLPGGDNYGWHWADWCRDPRQAYFKLWENIHGDETNLDAWVWALTFEVIQANVDAILEGIAA